MYYDLDLSLINLTYLLTRIIFRPFSSQPIRKGSNFSKKFLQNFTKTPFK